MAQNIQTNRLRKKRQRKPTKKFQKWLSEQRVVLNGTEKYIPLTRGRWAVVDAEDYHRIAPYNWYSQRNGKGKNLYAARKVSRDAGSRCGMQYMHRFLLGLTDRGRVADHINGCTLDNRKSNLRECSRSENSRNRRADAGNKLGLKGVSRDGKRFRAEIQRGRIGNYSSPVEAGLSYNAKAIAIHGKFARLNSLEDFAKNYTLSTAQLARLKSQFARLAQLLTQTDIPLLAVAA
jgi:hypothetical protein